MYVYMSLHTNGAPALPTPFGFIDFACRVPSRFQCDYFQRFLLVLARVLRLFGHYNGFIVAFASLLLPTTYEHAHTYRRCACIGPRLCSLLFVFPTEVLLNFIAAGSARSFRLSSIPFWFWRKITKSIVQRRFDANKFKYLLWHVLVELKFSRNSSRTLDEYLIASLGRQVHFNSPNTANWVDFRYNAVKQFGWKISALKIIWFLHDIYFFIPYNLP